MPIAGGVIPAVDSYSTAYHVGEVVGLLVALALAAFVIRRALTQGFGRLDGGVRTPGDLAIALLALGVAVALGVSSVDRGLFDSSSRGPWSTAAGVNEKAGFIAGCTRGTPSRAGICECVFVRLSSIPPYDTPAGFTALVPTFRRYAETHDASLVPAAVLDGIRSCVAVSQT
jgi:hypothetical protein